MGKKRRQLTQSFKAKAALEADFQAITEQRTK